MTDQSHPQLSDEACKRILQLAFLSDAEFARAHLCGLTAKERADFLKECPDFPPALLS